MTELLGLVGTPPFTCFVARSEKGRDKQVVPAIEGVSQVEQSKQGVCRCESHESERRKKEQEPNEHVHGAIDSLLSGIGYQFHGCLRQVADGSIA